jgi:hypothetical protein
MRSKIIFAVGIVASLVFTVAAAPSANAAPDDACTLLTQKQVADAVGVPVNSGAHTTPTYLKTCTWASPTGAAKGVKVVTLDLQAADRFAAGKRLMEQSMAAAKVQDKNAASASIASAGIGDDAYYMSTGAGYTGLMVKKGSVAFKLAIYGDMPNDKKKDVEKALALEVLSKL